MITSPAFRALETAIIFADEFDIEPEKIMMDSNLYYKMNFNYLSELLSVMSNDIESVTFFGHNPSFTEIANKLCNNGSGFIPKSGVVGISFKIKKWTEVGYKTGNMEYFLKAD
jgi:phosphohistidine phosphatase